MLTINESYIVGVGGPCDAFSNWSTFGSFSSQEINALELSGRSGSICITHKQFSIIIGVTVPLAFVFTIAVISAVIVVTICAVRKRNKDQKQQSTATSHDTTKDENEMSSKVEDDNTELI